MTTSIALSPRPGPKPARCFSFSATSGSVMVSSVASVQAGACSFSTEQMIIGTFAAVGAGSGANGCCGRMVPSTDGLKPPRRPVVPDAAASCASLRCALVAIS